MSTPAAPHAFDLLGVPPLPWLEPEALKSRFFALSNDTHPDRFHSATPAERDQATQRYASLNAAYSTLKETKDRLRLLLEIELGQLPRDIQKIPPGTMDLFVEIGEICRQIDAFAASSRPDETSPMLRLQRLRSSLEWMDKLQTLTQRIQDLRSNLDAELARLNALWETAPPPGAPERRTQLPLDRLEQLYRTASFIARWLDQLQERRVLLAQ